MSLGLHELRCQFACIEILIIEIRCSDNRLTFIIRIPTPWKMVFVLRWAQWAVSVILYYQWRNSCSRDKMVWWTPYLYNGKPFIWKDGLYIAPRCQMVFCKLVVVNLRAIIKCGMTLHIHSSNLNSAAVEVWEWINNSIPHFAESVITYPEIKDNLC